MNRDEILVKEYELCPKHNNFFSNQYWIIVGIFMAINTPLLGWVAFSLVTNIDNSSLVLALIISVGATAMLVALDLYVGRINFIIQCNYDRIHEIESILHMWKCRRVNALDHWEDGYFYKSKPIIPEEQRKELFKYHNLKWWKEWIESRGYKKPTGHLVINTLFGTLISFWILIIIISIGILLKTLISNA